MSRIKSDRAYETTVLDIVRMAFFASHFFLYAKFSSRMIVLSLSRQETFAI